MNWLDIVILALLIASVVVGFISGFIKMIFSLVGLIIGVVLAGQFYTNLAQYLTFMPGDSGPAITAFIIIFLAVMIAAALLGFLFTKLISAVLLGWLNRLCGALLGLFLGAIFIAAILAITARYAGPIDAITESVVTQILLDKVPIILALLPQEFDFIRNYFN
jgi:membrane protein required for colicin V production